MPENVSKRSAKNVRSPELERLIRTLEIVASDLPRILRKEKEVAFSSLERVDLFEAHMKVMRALPAQLEALTRVVDKSLQINGAAAHLSRAFQAIHNMRPVDAPAWEDTEPVGGGGDNDVQNAPEKEMPALKSGPETPSSSLGVRTDPATGDVVQVVPPKPPYHPLDLNLERVRNAIVPGGEISGRSMVQSSRARLVTARASGSGPWRFQFRKGSLEWAAEAEEKGLRGVAAMICDDLGYVEIPAKRLLEKGRDHFGLSSGGNVVLRPALAVYELEAILHPGAMNASRPGEAEKLSFVEF